MDDCIFCKIANREIGSNIRYEDEKVIAFDDINKVAPIHILVIPKEHIECLNDIKDMNIMVNIYNAISKIVNEAGIKDSGYRIVVNTGKDGGQVVKHLHFHILGGKPLGDIH